MNVICFKEVSKNTVAEEDIRKEIWKSVRARCPQWHGFTNAKCALVRKNWEFYSKKWLSNYVRKEIYFLTALALSEKCCCDSQEQVSSWEWWEKFSKNLPDMVIPSCSPFRSNSTAKVLPKKDNTIYIRICSFTVTNRHKENKILAKIIRDIAVCLSSLSLLSNVKHKSQKIETLYIFLLLGIGIFLCCSISIR